MDTISFSCPHCSQVLTAETQYCGQLVYCTKCRSQITIPQKPVEQENPAPAPTSAPASAPAPEQTKTPEKPSFSFFKVMLFILVILQLGCFALLLKISWSTGASPDSYEYKIHRYNRYNRDDFDSSFQPLAKEGWEYVGTVSGDEMLLRRTKRISSSEKKGKE